MSLNNQVVLVIGATGVVGSGVVRKYLDAGAQVVGISRSQDKLDQLRKTMNIGDSQGFSSVVADFKDEAAAQKAHADVSAALGGKPIDHIVSVQGFAAVTAPATSVSLQTMQEALADGLYNNFLAAKAFLPDQKERDGASFTLVSGGLAHFAHPNPAMWLGSVKNAALNGLSYGLMSETAKNKVRVNTICIHFGVAPAGGNTNQFGMNADGDTLRLAPAFLGLARGTQKGKIFCLTSWAEAEKLAE